MPTVQCGFSNGPGVLGQNLLVQRGPTLQVQIGFDPNYQGAPQIPALPPQPIEALVDSGATESCIDSGLAMQLNLPIVNQVVIAGVGGIHNVNVHLAHIYIAGLGVTIDGAFAAVNLAAGGQTHLALIGRTFLMHFRMMYDGLTGAVSITNDPIIQAANAGGGP